MTAIVQPSRETEDEDSIKQETDNDNSSLPELFHRDDESTISDDCEDIATDEDTAFEFLHDENLHSEYSTNANVTTNDATKASKGQAGHPRLLT